METIRIKSKGQKIVIVIKNGAKINMIYEDICKDLGFIASVKFIRVTNRGTISFTAGKLDEIQALKRAAEIKGYKPSKALCDAVRL